MRAWQGTPDDPNNARLATYRDLQRGDHYDPDSSWWVGYDWQTHWYRFGRPKRRRIYTHKDRSLLVFGPPGCGKSNAIKAQVLIKKHWRCRLPDMLVTDPANLEIYQATRQTAEELKYRIVTIDLCEPEKSTRYDPLVELEPGTIGFGREVAALCELLMPDEAESRNRHFTEFPRVWLAGVIAHCMTKERNKATLPYCLLKATCSGDERKELIASMRKSSEPLIKQAASAFDEVGDRERGSFISTMTRAFRPFLFEEVRMVCQPGEDEKGNILRGWSWRDVFASPEHTIFYVRSGLDGGMTGAFMRLLIGNAINARKKMLAEGFVFPKDFQPIIDEADMLGDCPPIFEAQDRLRKARVRIMLCYLSPHKLYSSMVQAKSLVSTCDVILAGGMNDYEAAEGYSRLIGDMTQLRETRNRMGSSYQEHRERLIPIERIRTLPYPVWLTILGPLQVIADKPFKRLKGNRIDFN